MAKRKLNIVMTSGDCRVRYCTAWRRCLTVEDLKRHLVGLMDATLFPEVPTTILGLLGGVDPTEVLLSDSQKRFGDVVVEALSVDYVK